MNKNIKYLIIPVWIIVIYILKANNMITFNLTVIKQYLGMTGQYAILIFIFIWMLRILIFIPGVTLTILGGVCFGTLEGFLLSMLGVIFSETIIFIISKTFIGSKLKVLINNKYPHLNLLIEEFNCKLLGLGIICPVAPTDVVCFLSASSGINYSKYIITVIVSNIPGILLYSFLGLSFTGSVFSIGLIVISIVMITIFTSNIWNNIKRKVDISN